MKPPVVVFMSERIPEDRGPGKVKLSEFLQAVFCKDEFDDDAMSNCSSVFTKEADIGNSFFGSTIEGFEDECDAAYAIKSYMEALTAFEAVVAKKIEQVYKVIIGNERNLLRIMEMVDNAKTH